MEQRSAEWYAAKAGKIGASEMMDVMAKNTTATYRNLIARKVAERLTGQFSDSFTSSAMQWGIDHEDDARDHYFVVRGLPVQDEGFVPHPDLGHIAGASPDGLVGENGLVEIKCPNTATHIEYLRLKRDPKKIPNKYLYQMQWQMDCTKRDWCDFVSYDPRMPIDLQVTVIRVERDQEVIDKLSAAIKEAGKDIETIINDLRETP